ncbi:hypothetical protein [Methylorubrum extorquens]|uniref:hypothetical protein n=1 Tax=Methylorubrum extorquens TaxID=408 RepID=UPI001EE5D014|nr:hypothetical protein [Methylorubrum extorquens]MCG5249610.1 hypothetical protein [Methylorubrum extorquens]
MGEFDWWLLVVVPAVVGLATAYSQRFIDLFARVLWQGWRKRRVRKYHRDMIAVIHDIALDTFYPRLITWITRGTVALFLTFVVLFALEVGIMRANPDMTYSSMTLSSWIVRGVVTFFCMIMSGYAGLMFGRATRYVHAFLDPILYVKKMKFRILAIQPETDTADMDAVTQLAFGIVLRREKQLMSLMNERP